MFRFHLPSWSSGPVIRDLLSSFRLSSAERVLHPPAGDLSLVLIYFVSPALEPLSPASFHALPLPPLFLLAIATAKRVGELQALSSIVTFVAGGACLSSIPQFVAKSESHPFHPSLLLGDVLSRLCDWSSYRPPILLYKGPQLVSASGQVFVFRSPSPFRVPSAPFSRYVYERSVVLFGGGLFCR